jgi:hypothetical protein
MVCNHHSRSDKVPAHRPILAPRSFSLPTYSASRLINMRILILAISLSCCSFASANDLSNTSQADQQANAAARLFMDACVASLGDEARLKAWVRGNGLISTSPGFSKKILRGQSGEVWSAKNEIGDFLVIIGLPYQCAAWARRANARLAIEHFQRLVKGVERPGLSVKLEKDQELQGQGGIYRQVVYVLRKQGSVTGWAILATASESAAAEVQVRFTVSPVK